MNDQTLNPYSPHYRPPAKVELFPGQFVGRSLKRATVLFRRCTNLLNYAKADAAGRASITAAVGPAELEIERILFNTLLYVFLFSSQEWRFIAGKAEWTADALDTLVLNDWLVVQGEMDIPGLVTIDPGVVFFWGREGLI